MKAYDMGNIADKLEEKGVECLDTFLKLKDSELKEFGLNTGQRKKCLSVALRIKEKGISPLNSCADVQKTDK